MKNIYIKMTCAISLITMISFIACKKEFLDKQPIGQLSQNVLATKSGANKLLIGAYSGLEHKSIFGYNSFFAEIASHEAIWGAVWDADANSFENHKGNPAIGIYSSQWGSFYSAIQRANDVLRLLPLVPANELSADEALQLKAEAVFLRAVVHFRLAKTWLNVPYIDETVTFNAGNYNVPNTTSIWPKIEADFRFAADNLTETKTDAGRANSWAAKAFLAEVYMHQQKYAEALPLLTDCITNGGTASGQKYKLSDKYWDNFDANTENNAEEVFAIQYTINDGSNANNSNQDDLMFQPMVPVCAGGGTGACSFDMVNTYKTDPVTGLPLLDTYNDFNITNDQGLQASDPFTPYTGTLDPRLDNTVARRGIPLLDWGLFGPYWIYSQADMGCYGWKKFFFNKSDLGVNSESYGGWTTANNTNDILIRFADILLRAAECEVEVGSLANAEMYVNMVRARAANPAGWVKTYVDDNDPSKGFTNTPAANYFIGQYTGQFTANGQAYARKAVRFERRLELALEGHRFYDLQRWDKGTGSMADELNYIIDHENNHTTAGFPNLKGVVFTKGKNELYPIPQTEIDLSMVNGKSVLVQNPGYN